MKNKVEILTAFNKWKEEANPGMSSDERPHYLLAFAAGYESAAEKNHEIEKRTCIKESAVRGTLINFLLQEIKVENLDSIIIDRFIQNCKAV